MAGLCFIGLNVLDAYLTGICLGFGAVEVNPLMYAWGDCMWAKGLVAAAIVVAIRLRDKDHMLYYINMIILGIVIWNAGQCLLAFMK